MAGDQGKLGTGGLDRAKADVAFVWLWIGEAPGRVGKSRWGLDPTRHPRPYIIPTSSQAMYFTAL